MIKLIMLTMLMIMAREDRTKVIVVMIRVACGMYQSIMIRVTGIRG